MTNEKIAELYVELKAENKELKAELKKTLADAEKAGNSISKTFNSDVSGSFLKASLAAEAISKAVNFAANVTISFARNTAQYISASIQNYSKLEMKVKEIASLTQSFDKQDLSNIQKQVLDLSVAFGETQEAVAKANYDIVSAGFTKTADAAKVLNAALRLSTIGVTDAAVATDLMTSALNAYGLQAEKSEDVTRILFQTVQLGKTTIPELAQSFGQLAPIAAGAGVSLEETAAAIATVTAGGMKTTEAMTAIKGTMSALIKPSEEMKNLFSALGVESGEALIKQEGFAKSLELISKRAKEMNIPLTNVFGNIRGLAGVMSLSRGEGEKYKENLAKIEAKAVDVNLVFDNMSNSLEKNQAKFSALTKAISTLIGQAFEPLAAGVLDEVNKKLEIFYNVLSDKNTIKALQEMGINSIKIFSSIGESADDLQAIFSGFSLKDFIKSFSSLSITEKSVKQFVEKIRHYFEMAEIGFRALANSLKNPAAIDITIARRIEEEANAIFKHKKNIERIEKEHNAKMEAERRKAQEDFEDSFIGTATKQIETEKAKSIELIKIETETATKKQDIQKDSYEKQLERLAKEQDEIFNYKDERTRATEQEVQAILEIRRKEAETEKEIIEKKKSAYQEFLDDLKSKSQLKFSDLAITLGTTLQSSLTDALMNNDYSNIGKTIGNEIKRQILAAVAGSITSSILTGGNLGSVLTGGGGAATAAKVAGAAGAAGTATAATTATAASTTGAATAGTAAATKGGAAAAGGTSLLAGLAIGGAVLTLGKALTGGTKYHSPEEAYSLSKADLDKEYTDYYGSISGMLEAAIRKNHPAGSVGYDAAGARATAKMGELKGQLVNPSVFFDKIGAAIAAAGFPDSIKNPLVQQIADKRRELSDKSSSLYRTHQNYAQNAAAINTRALPFDKYALQFRNGGYTGYGNPNDIAGVVHKQEFVLNKQQTDRLKNNGIGNNITINISGSGNPEAVANAVMQKLNQKMRFSVSGVF